MVGKKAQKRKRQRGAQREREREEKREAGWMWQGRRWCVQKETWAYVCKTTV